MGDAGRLGLLPALIGLLDGAAAGWLVLDEAGRVSAQGGSAAEFLGRDPAALVGLALDDLLLASWLGDPAGPLQQALRGEALASGAPPRAVRVRLPEGEAALVVRVAGLGDPARPRAALLLDRPPDEVPGRGLARHLLEDLERETGQRFIDGLTRATAEALGVDLAMVAEVVPGSEPKAARSVSLVLDGALAPSEDYPLLGTPCAEVIASEGGRAWTRGVQETFPEDRALQVLGIEAFFGFALRAPDSPTPVGWIALLFREPREDATRILEFLEGIGPRLTAELQRLRTEEDAWRLAELVERSSNEVYLADLSSLRFVDANPSALRNLGYTLEEFRRMTPAEVRAPDCPVSIQERMGPLIRGEREAVQFRSRHVRRDGTTYPVDLTVQRLLLRGRPMISAIGVDASERAQLEERLRTSQQFEAVGRLAGGVAHDFNNLLTAMVGNLEVLRSGIYLDPDALEGLADLQLVIDRAADLTRQLLAYARQQVIQPVVLDLSERLLELGRLLRTLAGGGVAFQLEVEPEVGRIRVDPGQLEQVLVNLVVNARDAQPQGGRVSVRLRALREGDERWAELSVSDQGPGMSPEVQARIFEPFFTTKARGSGLGLATCQGVVIQNGGRLEVESAPGAGSTFRVLLPLVAGPAPADEPAPLAAASPSAARVLLVEDDPLVRKTCARALSRAGFEVQVASDGAEARALLDSEVFAALVTDVLLPDDRGSALGSYAQARQPEISLLYVSGLTEGAQDEVELVEGENFLSKPYTSTQLVQTLRALLEA